MHTVSVIAGGLVLLALFSGAGWAWRKAPGLRSGAAAFVPVWLGIALVNMWIGVSRAGYTVAQELPILAVIFAVPALAAWIVRRRLA